MNEHVTSEGKLLGEVLSRATTDQSVTEPIDLETLTMFVEGQLPAKEQANMLELLDRDSEARETVSLLLKTKANEQDVEPKKKKWNSRNVAILAAMAASLLIVVGLLYLPGQLNKSAERSVFETAQNQLRSERYQEARKTLEDAANRGVESDRLGQLHVQAVLESPAPVALASRGRLSDFGYQLDGVAAREPASGQDRQQFEEALELIQGRSADSNQMKLNLGYTMMQLGQLDEAGQVFNSLVESNPELPLAWLGLGLVQYVQEDFQNAEVSFRRCLEHAPENMAARINLAMTLTELGKLEKALETWIAIPLETLPSGEQQQIRAEIETLKQFIEQEKGDR
jgi:tetratricopeptide (TPR) repeat protein